MEFESIGKSIQNARKAAGITQGDLATAIGKSRSLVQKYENNLAKPPLDVIVEIAKVLNVDYISLLANANEPLPFNELRNLSDREFEYMSKSLSLDSKVQDLLCYIIDMFYKEPE